MIRTHDLATLGLWGPKARDVLGRFAGEDAVANETFTFATAKDLELRLPKGTKMRVWAARISYVGESGWEIYLDNDSREATALFDACLDEGVVPVGIETYATSRRLEKSFRLQGADLETEYNACESAVQRPQVKPADFQGKQAHLSHRNQEPCALLCTMTIDSQSVGDGPTRYLSLIHI